VVGELHACRTQRAMLRHTTPMERSRWNLQRGESWRTTKRSKTKRSGGLPLNAKLMKSGVTQVTINVSR